MNRGCRGFVIYLIQMDFCIHAHVHINWYNMQVCTYLYCRQMDFLFSESSPQTVSFAQPEWENTQPHQTLCWGVMGTLQPALGEEVLGVLEIFLRHGQSVIAKKDKRLKKIASKCFN